MYYRLHCPPYMVFVGDSRKGKEDVVGASVKISIDNTKKILNLYFVRKFTGHVSRMVTRQRPDLIRNRNRSLHSLVGLLIGYGFCGALLA